MSAEHRPFPPSPERFTAAVRAGLLVNGPLLVGGAALLAVGMVLSLGGGWFGATLLGLMRHGVTASASTAALESGWQQSRLAVGGLALALGIPSLIAVTAAALLPAVLLARGRGATTVPLPEEPRASSALLVPRLVAFVLCALLVLRAAVAAREIWARFEWSGAALAAPLGAVVSTWLVSCGVVLLSAGSVEVALRAMALRRALRLCASEADREDRALGRARRPKGAP